MVKTAGIAGAGLMGRLLALGLLKDGWAVSIFDRDDRRGRRSCGFIAGGMLSLYSEAETIGDLTIQLGHRSMELWPEILHSVGASECLKVLGSVIVAHSGDLQELERIRDIIRRKFPDIFGNLSITDEVHVLERGLSVKHGVYIQGEGCIDSMQLFSRLEAAITRMGARWFADTSADAVVSRVILANGQKHVFDVVFDCRGIGARRDIPGLRGVRGEGMLLYAPEVVISRPVRMVHPRYSVYIVPRLGGKFMIGATEIESCDFSEVSVKSALELLSAVYSVHKGFAEARVLGMASACRPAFSDNLPRIMAEDGMVRINGLYRHGYLSAPAIVEEVVRMLRCGDARYPKLHIGCTAGSAGL
ncbi:FAD-dependent oxidoreductase [Anaplasma capra]|uniref:FAD-dependent oxidoreductase n=1 Tax=Anaplasma capra TaxID=1562740 RepID=UPI0021D5DA91|nr:FAD-dependent oxidoreductase [Anaplasma capra]MCU7611508.1 FAD-dependent oxidoreductase [Anaplasma capra]MCU7612053.1 FAD-dependent oxidoreductase [Anaplasma capra]